MRWLWVADLQLVRRMAKPSKRSRSKGNSLPPTKRFYNMTTLRSYSVVSVWISFGTILSCCDGSLRWPSPWRASHISSCLHLFFRGKTALQLLEVVIHHGEIKPLGGWQAVAFATRTLGGKVGHSTSTNSVNLFSLGQHKEWSQVLIDKEGVCLSPKVIIRC